MQAKPGMQALRTLCARKHLHLLTSQSIPSRPSLYFSRFSPNLQKFIHSTNQRYSEAATFDVDGIKGWTSSSTSSDEPSSEPEENPNDDTTTGDLVPKVESSYDNNKRHGKGFSGNLLRGGSIKKKKVTTYVCSDCGHSHGLWYGHCNSCEAAGTLKKFIDGVLSESSVSVRTGTWLNQPSIDNLPLRLTDVQKRIQPDWRFPLSGLLGNEVSRVLGGGLVPGSLVLVGGDPGVGKSTLMLQIAAIISEGDSERGPAPVVYTSGEESVEQIGNRADRMGIRTEELFLYSSTDIQDILKKTENLSPRALIVDSIQTVYHKDVAGTAGGIAQVRECTSVLLRFAKDRNVPVLLTGHVTKTGDIAGPRVLEHIVDVVLYMELGVLEMSESGLQAVSNPSEIFLSEWHEDSAVLAGLAVAVTIDGSRSFLMEIQALYSTSSSSSRQVIGNVGIPGSRVNLIVAVLTEQAGLKLRESGILVSVVGGYNLVDTAGDLAIAAAICSSYLEFPIPKGVAFIGEIGLAGELRPVSRMEKRVSTVAQMGYKRCVVPESSVKSMSAAIMDDKIEILGCRNIKDLINTVFTTP
jgi:DNA repair protein RadA/Sms